MRMVFLLASVSMLACETRDNRQPEDSVLSRLASPAVVTLTATDFAFETPDSVESGWITFRLLNQGGQLHMAQLIRLEQGMTVEQYLAAYGDAFRTRGPRPEHGRRLGGPTVTVPHDSTRVTLYLEPGNYLWICLYNLPDGIPHVVGHGMAQPFVVQADTGARSSQAAPETDVVMRLADYNFSLSSDLKAGRQAIQVQNAGVESHEVTVARLAVGKTVEDFLAWMKHPGDISPETILNVVGGTTSLASGAEAYFEVELRQGEYLLLCFVTAPDGRSHIDHGMFQLVRIE